MNESRVDRLNDSGGMTLNMHLKKEAAKAVRKILRKTGETKTAMVSRLAIEEAARCGN